jgi:hypothetical protein
MQIIQACRRGRCICGEQADVSVCHGVTADRGQQGAEQRNQQALVEYQVGVGLILAPHGLGDQRHCSHAENLGQRHHDELHIAGGADTGDSRIADLCNEVQVDQHIHHLEQHADRDGSGHAEQVLRDRALSEVLHGRPREVDSSNLARGGRALPLC